MIEEIIKIAKKELGVKESPAGSNLVKYNRWYYGKNQSAPWCATFCTWVYYHAGVPLPLIQKEGNANKTGSAYCPFIESHARKSGQWFNRPRRGDMALFHFGKNLAVHIGIVENVTGMTFTCLEGNTSFSSNDNGGAVMRRTRKVSQCRGFYRPQLVVKKGKNAYYRLIRMSDPMMYGNDIKEWQKQMLWWAYDLDVDGYYGVNSEKVCEDFQDKRGLEVDGIIGPNTWNETFKPSHTLSQPKEPKPKKPAPAKIEKEKSKKENDNMIKGFAANWIGQLLIEVVLPNLIGYLKEQAAKTETPIDDKIVEYLEDVLDKDLVDIIVKAL